MTLEKIKRVARNREESKRIESQVQITVAKR